MASVKNLIGQRFTRLLVIDRAQNDKDGNTRWVCKCDCGKTTIVSRTHLISHHTQSCGCLNFDTAKRSKHCQSDKRIYTIYYKMKDRCYNKKHKSYENYGGRGIKICDEWLENFVNFYEWAMQNGYQDNLTIDRIDNDGNYEPNNCRWVTYSEQANNKRNNRYYTYNGMTLTLKQWSEKYHINYSALRDRLNRNIPFQDALTQTKEELKKKRCRKIGMYDLNGNLIKTYEKLKDVKKDGFSNSLVCSTCRGIQKTSYGYKWKYLDNKEE